MSNKCLWEKEMETTRKVRDLLVAQNTQVKARHAGPQKPDLRRKLDECLLAFRVARGASAGVLAKEKGGWLRAVRQAIGIPVKEVARRLGVRKLEVLRLERVERKSRIELATMRRAAEALDCELVYAVIPRTGTLEDLAEAQRRLLAQEKAQVAATMAGRAAEVEAQIGFRAAILHSLRKGLREAGIRLR